MAKRPAHEPSYARALPDSTEGEPDHIPANYEPTYKPGKPFGRETEPEMSDSFIEKSAHAITGFMQTWADTKRRTLTEGFIEFSKTPLAQKSKSVGSKVLDIVERPMSALVAQERMTVRWIRGEDTVGHLKNPAEVLFNYDNRDPEILRHAAPEEFEKIGDKPRQKEIIKELVGEERLHALQNTPLEIGGLPLETDAITNVWNNLRGAELANVEGKGQILVSQEQALRFVGNIFNDPLFYLGFMKFGKGVRAVRPYAVDDLATFIGRTKPLVDPKELELADMILSKGAEALDDMLLGTAKAAELVSDIKPITEVVDVRNATALRTLGRSFGSLVTQGPTHELRSLWGVLKQLDPDDPAHVDHFLRVLVGDSSFDGFIKMPTGVDEAIDIGNTVDGMASSRYFKALSKTVSDFSKRAMQNIDDGKFGDDDMLKDALFAGATERGRNDSTVLFSLAEMEKYAVGDALTGVGFSRTPLVVMPDGRVIFKNVVAEAGNNVSTIDNPGFRMLWRMATGKTVKNGEEIAKSIEAAGGVFVTQKKSYGAGKKSFTDLGFTFNTEGMNAARRADAIDNIEQLLTASYLENQSQMFGVAEVLGDAVDKTSKLVTARGLTKATGIDDPVKALAKIKNMPVGKQNAIMEDIRKDVWMEVSQTRSNVLREHKVDDIAFTAKIEIQDGDKVLSAKFDNDMIGRMSFGQRSLRNEMSSLFGSSIVDDLATTTRKVMAPVEVGTVDNAIVKMKGIPHGTIDETLDAAGKWKGKGSPFEGVVEGVHRGEGGGIPPGSPAALGSGGNKLPMPYTREASALLTKGRDMTLFGFVRDPEQVLKGTGTFERLYAGYFGYERSLEEVSNLVNSRLGWLEKDSDASMRIARFLDGQKTDVHGTAIDKVLTADERRASALIKSMFDMAAKRLGIPISERIKDYFPHIIKAKQHKSSYEIPIEFLGLDDSGNIFFAHLLPRTKNLEPVWDIVEAMKAYWIGAARKAHLEPALKDAIKMGADLPPLRKQYLNMLIDRVKGKPTKLDVIIDEGIRNVGRNTGVLLESGARKLEIPISKTLAKRLKDPFGPAPATRISMGLTRAFYRGLLGGSLGFFIKNLSQSINTVADVGAMATLRGAAMMTTAEGNRLAKASKVLRSHNRMFEEVNIGGKLDNVLFSNVHFSEHMNRGIAWHAGASEEMRRLGVTMDQVLASPELFLRINQAGHTVSNRTQFIYGVLGRSPLFGTILGRMGGQFMTFPIKQSEFLWDMAKNDKTGLVRYLATTGYVSRLLSQMGVDPTGFVGFGFIPQGVESGVPVIMPPVFQMTYQLMRFSNSVATSDWDGAMRWTKELGTSLTHMVPGGLQARKTLTSFERAQTMKISNEVGELIRPLSDSERLMQFLSLPTIESKEMRIFGQTLRELQSQEEFVHGYLVDELLLTAQKMQEAKKKGDMDKAGDMQSRMDELVLEARNWQLPITSRAVQSAAQRQHLSTYLRRMLANKRLSTKMWNKFLDTMPKEAEALGIKYIPEGREDDGG